VKDKLIAGGGKLPLKETIPIIQAAVDALSYLHSKKCIHRDVKPSNILLLGSAYVLSDLGVVRWSDLNPEFTEAGTITNESIQLGSLRYMAPEQQVSSHEAVAQSDVYALGITWYELLTGSTIPAAQAAVGDFAAPTGNSRAAETIRAMFAYRPSARPSLDELRAILRELASAS
jgi:serine/threonine protein kinase